MTDIVAVETIGLPDEPPSDAPAQPWLSASSSYYTMFVLGIVVMFTILDRQVLALMIEPIKADYDISDTKAALLLGAAFSLTYAIAGLPIARLADHSNRRNLIAVCVAFWSASTMACGIARGYSQLFIARLGIGVGEAGYAPATWSMVTDTFPREKVAWRPEPSPLAVISAMGSRSSWAAVRWRLSPGFRRPHFRSSASSTPGSGRSSSSDCRAWSGPWSS